MVVYNASFLLKTLSSFQKGKEEYVGPWGMDATLRPGLRYVVGDCLSGISLWSEMHTLAILVIASSSDKMSLKHTHVPNSPGSIVLYAFQKIRSDLYALVLLRLVSEGKGNI